MTGVQDVELVYRSTGDSSPCDVIVAVQVGAQRLELPLDSEVRVVHDAGGIGGRVHVELLAGRVRYIPDETQPSSGPGR